jgi:hypothetical protein
MNPEQPAAPPPGNDYNFIVNPAERQVKTGAGSALKNPFVFKIVLIIIGIVIFMMSAGYIANLVLGKNEPDFANLTRLTQTQTELIRVADMGSRTSTQDMRNASVNDVLVLSTQRNEWTAYLASQGHGVGEKLLKSQKDKETETKLTKARQTSTFDTVFAEIMRTELTAYLTALKDAHGKAIGKKEKALLAKHYDQTKILLLQWPE